MHAEAIRVLAEHRVQGYLAEARNRHLLADARRSVFESAKQAVKAVRRTVQPRRAAA